MITSLTQLDKWHREFAPQCTPVLQYIYDGQRFIQHSFDVILQSALQVYHCGLALVPQLSVLQLYGHKLTNSCINLTKARDEAWSLCLRIIAGHSSHVTYIAFSSDNIRIISRSLDNTVRLWNASSVLKATLEGYSSRVTSVAFSFDNTC
ncbi:hypothetical protein M422DRAFT_37749, partial [Sphaerobolus stellatus SS14]